MLPRFSPRLAAPRNGAPRAPGLRQLAIGSATALALALTSVAPAQALGRDERNFLKGVAATLIIGTILKQANAGTPAPQRTPPVVHRQDPPPVYRYDPPRPQVPSGHVIGSTNSIYSTYAARAFNSYGHTDRRAIQSRLRAYGYYGGAIDGAFGPATYRAILAYARDTNGEGQLGSIAGTYGVYDSLLA